MITKMPDMDEMIQQCKDKLQDDEVICFAFGVGRMVPIFGKKKQMEEALDYIKKLDGFIGVHPVDLWNNLLVFDTLNNAKQARNLLRYKGCQTGNVAPIMVNKMYLKNGGMQNE